ncbi:MAG TPA: hypothetical protein V6D28_18140 [Leptolyngbyaceae cyanobacterium]
MKRVLIVTPNWPPISCPDMHRVRMSVQFFSKFDWEPLILKINPEEQEGIKDNTLNNTISDCLKIWEAGCLPKFCTSWFGLNNIGLRSFFHLALLGNEIIEKEKPDLAFFSTTMFPLMSLGRYWYSKYRLPYVLDFQDPWVSDYKGDRFYAQSWKYKLSQALAKLLEPFCLRQVAHIISVSPGYVDTLLKRYAWLKSDQFTVLPFGAAETDFDYLRKYPIKNSYFNPHDGKQHWVYVGRGGTDMAFAVRSFFQALREIRQQEPKKFNNLLLHFIGTDYAPGNLARKTIEPLAKESGIEDIVQEYPHRIPYFEALQCLLDADALIVPGSDDPSYTASKIYPYIQAKKPLLAIFHEKSSVVDVLHSTKAGTVVTFSSKNETFKLSQAIFKSLLKLITLPTQATDWQAFEPYSAQNMTHIMSTIFDEIIS